MLKVKEMSEARMTRPATKRGGQARLSAVLLGAKQTIPMRIVDAAQRRQLKTMALRHLGSVKPLLALPACPERAAVRKIRLSRALKMIP